MEKHKQFYLICHWMCMEILMGKKKKKKNKREKARGGKRQMYIGFHFGVWLLQRKQEQMIRCCGSNNW